MRFLDYAMCRNYKRFGFCIPKGEKPIAVATENSTEFPNIGVFQLLEQFIIYNALFYFLVVICYFLLHFQWQ